MPKYTPMWGAAHIASCLNSTNSIQFNSSQQLAQPGDPQLEPCPLTKYLIILLT